MISGHVSIILRLPGPEPGDRHGLHHRPALDRHGRPHDRVRRRRRDGRRRRRIHRVAAGHRRLRVGARAVHAQRRSRRPPRGRGTRIATASCWARAPACWCSRSTSTPSARGATIYAELVGLRHERRRVPHDRAQRRRPEPLDARGAAQRRHQRRRRSHYLNAHGTSTPLGDLNETNAIKLAFGDHAKKLAVSSTKSMTGHLLGGAGGIESVFTVLAMRDQVAPPTINLVNQDPECDLDYCANTAREMKIDVRGEEQLRLRRHQRNAGVPQGLTVSAAPCVGERCARRLPSSTRARSAAPGAARCRCSWAPRSRSPVAWVLPYVAAHGGSRQPDALADALADPLVAGRASRLGGAVVASPRLAGLRGAAAASARCAGTARTGCSPARRRPPTSAATPRSMLDLGPWMLVRFLPRRRAAAGAAHAGCRCARRGDSARWAALRGALYSPTARRRHAAADRPTRP